MSVMCRTPLSWLSAPEDALSLVLAGADELSVAGAELLFDAADELAPPAEPELLEELQPARASIVATAATLTCRIFTPSSC